MTILALAIGIGLFAVTTVAAIALSSVKAYGAFIAASACATLSFLFAVRWPDKSWRWGVLLSAGFLMYFIMVAMALTLKGQFQMRPILLATTVLLPSISAAWFGAYLSRRTRARHA